MYFVIFKLMRFMSIVTNILFVLRLEKVDVKSRHRENPSSKDRRHLVLSKDFRIIDM